MITQQTSANRGGIPSPKISFKKVIRGNRPVFDAYRSKVSLSRKTTLPPAAKNKSILYMMHWKHPQIGIHAVKKIVYINSSFLHMEYISHLSYMPLQTKSEI